MEQIDVAANNAIFDAIHQNCERTQIFLKLTHAQPVLAGLLLNVSTPMPDLIAAALTGVAFLLSLPILRLVVPAQDKLATFAASAD